MDVKLFYYEDANYRTPEFFSHYTSASADQNPDSTQVCRQPLRQWQLAELVLMRENNLFPNISACIRCSSRPQQWMPVPLWALVGLITIVFLLSPLSVKSWNYLRYLRFNQYTSISESLILYSQSMFLILDFQNPKIWSFMHLKRWAELALKFW